MASGGRAIALRMSIRQSRSAVFGISILMRASRLGSSRVQVRSARQAILRRSAAGDADKHKILRAFQPSGPPAAMNSASERNRSRWAARSRGTAQTRLAP